MRLDKGSARRRDFYLTTHKTHNKQTSMLSAGFEPAIPARELLETLDLDRWATGTGFAEYWAGVKPNNVFLKCMSFLKNIRSYKNEMG
jgi:hypothetical protein